MKNEQLIPVEHICTYYNIKVSFFDALQENGLVDITVVETGPCIAESQMGDVERMIRLHNDLDINVAGIEAITHLLHRVHNMQKQIHALEQKLQRFEEF